MNVDSEARLLLQLCVCNIAHLLVHGEKVSVCQHLAKGRLRKLGDTTYLVNNETLAISQLILAVGLDGDVGGGVRHAWAVYRKLPGTICTDQHGIGASWMGIASRIRTCSKTS